jgi:RHS repeat-associated protein
MQFDRMGRRIEYLETCGSATNANNTFTYDNYLLVARHRNNSDGTLETDRFIWDPTEPIATRPLVFYNSNAPPQYYTHDGNKNVSNLTDIAQSVVAHYAYSPFGTLFSVFGTSAIINPFRFSSEFTDDVLGLMYYNYRYYSAIEGRWTTFDPHKYENFICYQFCKNSPIESIDYLGLSSVSGACSVHGRGDEGQFDGIASRASGNWVPVTSGKDILEDMKRLSKSGNCIEKYTIAGHGWAYRKGQGKRTLGSGIPGAGDGAGLYLCKGAGDGSIGILEIEEAKKKGLVCFCKKCKIQIYSCRIDPEFSFLLAKATGCSVVSASGSCSTKGKKWKSALGYFEEKKHGDYFGFYKVTPDISPSNKISQVGTYYDPF